MYVRFERVEKPYSYNDSVITHLSWMHSETAASAATTNNNNTDNDNNNLEAPPESQEHFYGNPEHDESNVLDNDDKKITKSAMHKSENSLSEDELVKLDGWLAVGNVRGVIGVTFTTIYHDYQPDTGGPRLFAHSWQSPRASWGEGARVRDPARWPMLEPPPRTNYNLRGHRCEIILVKWNEPYQKLATCDKSGVIFVWIKYEGRWSIELINDRSTRVTDFAWSHDGGMALICYMDGFALVGSVNGQRFWSSMLNLNDCTITCGVWTPNDAQVLFGTSSGHIIVLSSSGTYLTQVCVQQCVHITSITFACRKFAASAYQHQHNHAQQVRHNHATESGAAASSTAAPANFQSAKHPVAITFGDGSVYFMRSYDDIFPNVVNTKVMNIAIDWSDENQAFLIGGHRVCRCRRTNVFTYSNLIVFYNVHGDVLKSIELEHQRQPLTALCFGNADRRIFVACGHVLLVGCIVLGFPKLSMLASYRIESRLARSSQLETLPLPERVASMLSRLFKRTLFTHLPDCDRLRQFVLRPPKQGIRLYCTLLRHVNEADSSDEMYVLYLEYMGGLVPLLKGKRSSKLKPEFVIFDPEQPSEQRNCAKYRKRSSSNGSDSSESDDNEKTTGCMTPRTQRRLMMFTRQRAQQRQSRAQSRSRPSYLRPLVNGEGGCMLAYNSLPETKKMIMISSNIWGTKFKFHSLMPSRIPANLGAVRYRTSLLHLQPRQMSLTIKELNESNTLPYKAECYDASQAHSKPRASHSGYNSATSDSEDERDALTELFPAPPIVPVNNLQSVRNSMLIAAEMAPTPVEENVVAEASRASPMRAMSRASTIESRLTRECSSVAEQLASLNDELLTLQIGQHGSSYNLELSLSKPKECTSRKAVTVVDSAEASDNHVAGVACTFVKQFKHQTFQSESPKHVCSYRQHNKCARSSTTSCTQAMSNSPNQSPNRNSHKKAAKESPRKSSVSYCQTEFSSASFVEHNVDSLEVCSPLRVTQYKSCSQEVYHLDPVACLSSPVMVASRGQDRAALTLANRRLAFKNNSKQSKSLELALVGSELGERSLADHAEGHCFNSCINVSSASNGKLEHNENQRNNVRLDNLEKIVTSTNDKSEAKQTKRTSCTHIRRTSLSMIEVQEEKTDKLSSRVLRPRTSEDQIQSIDSSLNSLAAMPSSSLHASKPVQPKAISSLPGTPLLERKRRKFDDVQIDGKRKSMGKYMFYSPGVIRKMKQKLGYLDCSSEDEDDESRRPCHAKPEKVKLRSKSGCGSSPKPSPSPSRKLLLAYNNLQSCTAQSAQHRRYRHDTDGHLFRLQNKAPLWNEVSQVYQLDFGGRVTQESAKNFQIEYEGKQVMQFGRIDSNAYTLDFEYPFSVAQALCIALANVTQRLK